MFHFGFDFKVDFDSDLGVCMLGLFFVLCLFDLGFNLLVFDVGFDVLIGGGF